MTGGTGARTETRGTPPGEPGPGGPTDPAAGPAAAAAPGADTAAGTDPAPGGAAPRPRPAPPVAVALARETVPPALLDWIARLGPDLATLCGYQMGLCDADGAPAPPGAAPGPDRHTPEGTDTSGRPEGGKLVRPALALATAAAAGAEPKEALPAALAAELVHNFTLLHDDVMDGDRVRRHRPAAWVRFGTPLAILAGDGLLALAFEVLSSHPAPGGADVTGDLARALRQLCLGQGRDLLAASVRPATGSALPGSPGSAPGTEDTAAGAVREISPEECLRTLEAKTGALLGFACRAGAAYAGAPPAAQEAFEQFGSRLGLAFQLQDDILGIWGRPGSTGKPALSDLRARKRSAPVVAALASGTAPGRRLGKLFARPDPLGEDELALAAELVEAAGGRDWTLAEAERWRKAAWGSLRPLELSATGLAGLRELTGRLAHRSS
ncbi:polyprenyl synthetase family protein [Streptomyces sp. MNU89]|uniref:polyprenyl synthetase family protein n=1 Tax=Streptomyces sp. MNU89 TaxID=2560025 RepID=UPI001E3FBD2B|nr:polyprenyl synthetase family protein [Streptomyces sp. MNU89]MCC9738633.1 polyprenyl synthetase family protein [Streptomyces sp. MNU89]